MAHQGASNMNQHHMISIHVFLLNLTPVLLQNAHVLFVIMTMGAMHVVKVTYRIYHMRKPRRRCSKQGGARGS